MKTLTRKLKGMLSIGKYHIIHDSYVPPKDGEFTVTKSLFAIIFDEDASVLESEQVERFNLEEHESEVDRLYNESGMQQ